MHRDWDCVECGDGSVERGDSHAAEVMGARKATWFSLNRGGRDPGGNERDLDMEQGYGFDETMVLVVGDTADLVHMYTEFKDGGAQGSDAGWHGRKLKRGDIL